MTTSAQVRQQVLTAEKELKAEFLERSEVIRFMLLTLLSKQHGFMLGPPGTAKSALVRALVGRLKGLPSYFEILLSKTRPDAAVLGPYDIALLRDKGMLRRNSAGMLQHAHIAFLDEIGKMGVTLGHDLLAILNERITHEPGEHGASVHSVPLMTAFTASNELIANESDDAAALWDRLLMRHLIDYIQSSSAFAALLRTAQSVEIEQTPTLIDYDVLVTEINDVIPNIHITEDVTETVVKLRQELLNDHGIQASDRRWKQSMRVVQANAWLDGRDQTLDDDVDVLKYTLWDSPEQIPLVARMTLQASNPMAEKIHKLLDAADELIAGVNQRKGQSLESRARYGAEAYGKLKTLVSDLGQIRQEALQKGRSMQKIDEAAERLNQMQITVYVECLDMTPEQAKQQA